MQPSTVGAATDLDSIYIEYKSIFDDLAGVEVFNQPLTIMSSAQTEGVDTPFFTMFSTAKDPTLFALTSKRAKTASTLRSTSYNQGMPTPIEDAPPDTTPITVGKLYDIPFLNYVRKRKNLWNLAGRATTSAPGYSSEFTPATTYSDISCRLLSEIQRHMLETTIDGGLTWSLWTQEEVLNYLNQRIVRFLMETGLIQTRTTVAVSAGVSDVSLPSDNVELRRVAWNSGSSVSVLTRIDTMALDYGSVGWQAASGVPYAYIEEPQDPLNIQLVPNPTLGGTVDILYVRAPTAITSTCVNLPVPSFLTPYVKYGVMADMFMKQGEANDPDRAEYCESRFTEGVQVTKGFLGVK